MSSDYVDLWEVFVARLCMQVSLCPLCLMEKHARDFTGGKLSLAHLLDLGARKHHLERTIAVQSGQKSDEFIDKVSSRTAMSPVQVQNDFIGRKILRGGHDENYIYPIG